MTSDQEEAAAGSRSPEHARCGALDHADRAAFLTTSLIALAVYLWTMAPDVTLGFAGIFSTAAFHVGVPHPPGYPLWTVYAWVFTTFLPFSNIAWRAAVSSAVAAALTCGCVAQIVSRAGAWMGMRASSLTALESRHWSRVRLVSGTVAGLGLAFDGAFWREALVANPWPLTMLLLASSLGLFMQWSLQPCRRPALYTAVFTLSLATTNSQLVFCTVPGLACMILVVEPRLRRDFCLVISAIFLTALWAKASGELPLLNSARPGLTPLRLMFLTFGLGSTVTWVWLTWRTRRLLTQWRQLMMLCLAFVAGTLPYACLPIISMTNPPINWAYARTMGGFLHLITRGQYERINPTTDLVTLGRQLGAYATGCVHDLGPLYLLAALVPLCALHRIPPQARSWLIGMLVVLVSSTLLTVMILNPSPDRQSIELVRSLLTAGHLMITTLAGCGLLLIAARLCRLGPQSS